MQKKLLEVLVFIQKQPSTNRNELMKELSLTTYECGYILRLSLHHSWISVQNDQCFLLTEKGQIFLKTQLILEVPNDI